MIYVERPALGEADAALVLVHGRGAGEHDLMGLFDALDRATAPRLLPRGPSPSARRCWYAVHGVSFDPQTFAEGSPP